MNKFTDILKVEGIKAMGYGLSYKILMVDRRLTIEAKAIYNYFGCYAGAGNTAFPSRKRICNDLCISKTRYYNHFKLLVDYGYIKVEQIRTDGGKFRHNIYTLIDNPIPVDNLEENNVPPCPKNSDTDKNIEKSTPSPCPRNRDTGNWDTNINTVLYNQHSVCNTLSLSPENSPPKNKPVDNSKDRQRETNTDEFYYILAKSQYNQFEAKYVDAILQAIRLLYYSSKPLEINSMRIPPDQVRQDLKKLEPKHVDLGLRDFLIQSEKQEIKFPVGYLSRCIYNAIFQGDLRIQSDLRFNGNIW